MPCLSRPPPPQQGKHLRRVGAPAWVESEGIYGARACVLHSRTHVDVQMCMYTVYDAAQRSATQQNTTQHNATSLGMACVAWQAWNARH